MKNTMIEDLMNSKGYAIAPAEDTISFLRSVSSEALLFLDSPTGTLSSFRTRSMLVWTRKLCSIWPAIIIWALY